MEVELIEIRQFLSGLNPFSYLDERLLDSLPADLEIRYLRRGSSFPPQDGYLYIVRSGAVELHDKKGDIGEKLGEGDIFSTACQLIDLSAFDRGEVVEDTLVYMMTCDRLKILCKQSDGFGRHFSDSVKERLKKAVSLIQGAAPVGSEVSQMMVEVRQLVRKPPLTVPATASIRRTAQVMTEADVSSAMILEGGQLVGLITDRDLRKRCVAAAAEPDAPVTTIMSADPETIQPSTLVSQALMVMTRMRVHHLPVVRDGELMGMITATDLTNHQSANSAYLATDVQRASDLDDLVAVSERLPNLHLRLSAASVTARHIGEAVSCLTDAITGRLLTMAERKLGPAPVPYVWMAGGSQARHEQSSHSDQDNALLLADGFVPEEHDAYFAALAKFVSDGLNACGFVYCPGDAMATNPKWRQPLKVWQRYFHDWINSPDPMSIMLSSIFFDLRPVTGEVSLFEPLRNGILEATRSNRIFLAYMMAAAMQHRPPLGFFRTFVLERGGGHDETLDLKHRGIVPITDVARVLALSEGIAKVNTLERLQAVAETPALTADMAENLADALEFIASLRIAHQADQIRKGVPADNYVPPEQLSSLEREHLKDAFKVIQTVQETMVKRFQADRLL